MRRRYGRARSRARHLRRAQDDPHFRVFAEEYARDEPLFFRDFAAAFAKLLALGCPASCNPHQSTAVTERDARDHASAEFREWAMHGSIEHVRKFAKSAE